MDVSDGRLGRSAPASTTRGLLRRDPRTFRHHRRDRSRMLRHRPTGRNTVAARVRAAATEPAAAACGWSFTELAAAGVPGELVSQAARRAEWAFAWPARHGRGCASRAAAGPRSISGKPSGLARGMCRLVPMTGSGWKQGPCDADRATIRAEQLALHDRGFHPGRRRQWPGRKSL